jgi:hypothetical protein
MPERVVTVLSRLPALTRVRLDPLEFDELIVRLLALFDRRGLARVTHFVIAMDGRRRSRCSIGAVLLLMIWMKYEKLRQVPTAAGRPVQRVEWLLPGMAQYSMPCIVRYDAKALSGPLD